MREYVEENVPSHGDGLWWEVVDDEKFDMISEKAADLVHSKSELREKWCGLNRKLKQKEELDDLEFFSLDEDRIDDCEGIEELREYVEGKAWKGDRGIDWKNMEYLSGVVEKAADLVHSKSELREKWGGLCLKLSKEGMLDKIFIPDKVPDDFEDEIEECSSVEDVKELVPRDGRGVRWDELGDDQLLLVGKKVSKFVDGSGELKKKWGRLYQKLQRGDRLDEIEFYNLDRLEECESIEEIKELIPTDSGGRFQWYKIEDELVNVRVRSMEVIDDKKELKEEWGKLYKALKKRDESE